MAIWKEHPWVGGGPDHFDHLFRKHREASDQLAGRPSRAHNDYLNTLADWGVIGLGLITAALGCLAWGFVRGWKYLQRTSNDMGGSRQSTRAALALGAASGLVAILAHSMVDFNMHIPANAITAITLMAMLTSFLRFSTERYWVTGAWWMRLIVSLPLLAWLAYVSQQALRLTHESRELAAAAAIKVYDQVRLDHLKKAFEIDDRNARTASDIGETYWQEASEGATGYEAAAKQAMEWFQRAMQLNPFDPSPLVRYGMCLDWLDRHDEAKPYFEKALAIDPNGFSTVGHMGWHLFQVGQYEEARKWLEKSQGLYPAENPLAYTYLKLIEKKIGPPKPAK